MIKLFEFTFLDIYNKEYRISIYDSKDIKVRLKAKIYGKMVLF